MRLLLITCLITGSALVSKAEPLQIDHKSFDVGLGDLGSISETVTIEDRGGPIMFVYSTDIDLFGYTAHFEREIDARSNACQDLLNFDIPTVGAGTIHRYRVFVCAGGVSNCAEGHGKGTTGFRASRFLYVRPATPTPGISEREEYSQEFWNNDGKSYTVDCHDPVYETQQLKGTDRIYLQQYQRSELAEFCDTRWVPKSVKPGRRSEDLLRADPGNHSVLACVAKGNQSDQLYFEFTSGRDDGAGTTGPYSGGKCALLKNIKGFYVSNDARTGLAKATICIPRTTPTLGK